MFQRHKGRRCDIQTRKRPLRQTDYCARDRTAAEPHTSLWQHANATRTTSGTSFQNKTSHSALDSLSKCGNCVKICAVTVPNGRPLSLNIHAGSVGNREIQKGIKSTIRVSLDGERRFYFESYSVPVLIVFPGRLHAILWLSLEAQIGVKEYRDFNRMSTRNSSHPNLPGGTEPDVAQNRPIRGFWPTNLDLSVAKRQMAVDTC